MFGLCRKSPKHYKRGQIVLFLLRLSPESVMPILFFVFLCAFVVYSLPQRTQRFTKGEWIISKLYFGESLNFSDSHAANFARYNITLVAVLATCVIFVDF